MVFGLGIAGGILLYGNRAFDAVIASQFKPTEAVAAIHSSLKLTNEGNDLLYASQPIIETGQAFNSACASTERTQAILGCYNMRKIYLYDVANPDLAGAKEVTAAHEMLHAAYDRLNIFERPQIDKMLNDQYQKLQNDKELSKLVAYYNQAEPGALTNELHSILGTIETTLSPDLEAYYARYFTNRQAIVAMNQKYNAVFDAVDTREQQLVAQIAALKPTVEADLNQYHADLQRLNNDIAAFNTQVSTGVYKTQSAFNAARQALLSRVSTLNVRRASVNSDIAAYNALVAEQNKLSVKVQELNSSINAAPAAGGI